MPIEFWGIKDGQDGPSGHLFVFNIFKYKLTPTACSHCHFAPWKILLKSLEEECRPQPSQTLLYKRDYLKYMLQLSSAGFKIDSQVSMPHLLFLFKQS